MAMVSAGTDIGNIVSVVASPIIAANFGWTFIHISFAGLNVIWLVLFAVFGASAPHVDRRISEVEKNFIARETSPMRRRASVENRNVILQVCSASPWRELIFNSKTAAICISQTCFGFGWYIFLSWLPRYLQDGIGLDLSSKSFLAALPYFIGFVGLLLSGMLSDYIISKEIISTLNCRKLFNTVGSLGPAVCLFVLPVINDELTAITLLCISMFLARFSVCGHNINIIDVAPQHAGQLLGFCNTIGTFSGIAANILTGKILEQTGSWKLIFWIPAVLNIIGSIVFLIFADIEPIIPIEDDLLNGPEAENLISA
jgi:sugar phosphate permease